MRTSLTEIKNIETYLQGAMAPQDRLVFEARLITSPMLRLQLQLQKQLYTLLKLYHRRKLGEEVAAAHQRLFQDPERAHFQQSIYKLFNQSKP